MAHQYRLLKYSNIRMTHSLWYRFDCRLSMSVDSHRRQPPDTSFQQKKQIIMTYQFQLYLLHLNNVIVHQTGRDFTVETCDYKICCSSVTCQIITRTAMVNNSDNTNKTNNRLSPEIIYMYLHELLCGNSNSTRIVSCLIVCHRQPLQFINLTIIIFLFSYIM